MAKPLRGEPCARTVSPQKAARPGECPEAIPGDLAEAAAEKVGAVQGVGSLPLCPWGLHEVTVSDSSLENPVYCHKRGHYSYCHEALESDIEKCLEKL